MQKHHNKLSEVRKFFLEVVKQHEATFDEHNLRDFIDAYLIEKREEEDLEKLNPISTQDHLIIEMMDLFLAGYETMSKTMAWACLFMIQ